MKKATEKGITKADLHNAINHAVDHAVDSLARTIKNGFDKIHGRIDETNEKLIRLEKLLLKK